MINSHFVVSLTIVVELKTHRGAGGSRREEGSRKRERERGRGKDESESVITDIMVHYNCTS